MSEFPAGRGSAPRFRLWNLLIAAAAAVAFAAIDASMHDAEPQATGHFARDEAITLAVGFAASLVNILAHELGHLVIALVLRMRPVEIAVLGIRISTGRAGDHGPRNLRNYVWMTPNLEGRLLAPRYLAVSLAGPVANLGLAAYCYLQGSRTGLTPVDKASWLIAAVVGATMGVGNLLPAGWWGSARSTDGSKAIRWLFWPNRMRDASAKYLLAQQLAQHRTRATQGKTPDRDALRRLTASTYPDVASAAAGLLLTADARDMAAFAEDEPLFLELAASNRVTAKVATLLEWSVAWMHLMTLFDQHFKEKRAGELDPVKVAEIAAMAEAGYARDPESLRMRYLLSLIRTLQDRPEEGRALLVNVAADRLPARERVNLLSIRALAEVELGDVPQARRLAEATRREGGDSSLLKLALHVIERAEQRER